MPQTHNSGISVELSHNVIMQRTSTNWRAPMKQAFPSRVLAACACVFTMFAIGQTEAFCQFEVDWGKSFDSGNFGYKDIGQWLVENNYYDSLEQATAFAKEGYLGALEGDADPYYWSVAQPVSVEVVQELASFSDENILGFYTGGGHFKTMTQIFGGTEQGPTSLSISDPFGLYVQTPQQFTWFTDRGENDDQKGGLRRRGGNAQALIYELKPDAEWLVAWEDLDATRLEKSDRDYQDMFVKLTVVPEPISSALFVLGGGALGAARWRKRKKA
jgi:hypothetical protein